MSGELLYEAERRRIEPLQIIDEDHQRMLGPSEYADEAPEHGLEADLGVQRRKCGHVRLRTDHPNELRHQVREQAAVGPHRLEDGVAPPRDLGRFSVQDLPDQRLESLGHARVWDVATALIELAGDENATRKHDLLVQFADHRRLADPGVARHELKMRFAGRGDAVERIEQRCYLTFASVKALGDKQAIWCIARRQREWVDAAGPFQCSKAGPQIGLKANGSLVPVLSGLGE